MESQTFTEGEAQALTRNAFTYDGYTFAGWNTVQGGSGASYNDQQTITAIADMTLYAQWTSNGTNPTPDPTPGPTPPEPPRHEYVDLGLPSGTLWATCNIGANAPEEYGDYFAWGETEPKDNYSWANYKYSAEGASCGDPRLTKYCNDSDYGNDGFTDALTTLEASDDAATANWGAGWRMPTREEFNELKNNCTVTWTTQRGVNGRLFTGPNGNSIFLPAAGVRYDSELYSAGSYGCCWSSSLGPGYTDIACYLYFVSDDYGMFYDDRYFGRSVRAVCAQ